MAAATRSRGIVRRRSRIGQLPLWGECLGAPARPDKDHNVPKVLIFLRNLVTVCIGGRTGSTASPARGDAPGEAVAVTGSGWTAIAAAACSLRGPPGRARRRGLNDQRVVDRSVASGHPHQLPSRETWPPGPIVIRRTRTAIASLPERSARWAPRPGSAPSEPPARAAWRRPRVSTPCRSSR